MTAKIAALHTEQASLVLEVAQGGPPLWRHLGAAVDPGALVPLAETRAAASFSLDSDVPFSSAPPAGLGWFGPAVLSARRLGQAGAPVPSAGELIMPQFSAQVEANAEAITITLDDALQGVRLEQEIRIAPGRPAADAPTSDAPQNSASQNSSPKSDAAFLFDARLTNMGDSPLALDWLASALIPLPASSAEIISWRGRHNGELAECREAMPEHAWRREGRRGISGHGGPPGAIVLGEGAGRHKGLVYALQLAWSGDSCLAIERDDEGYWNLSAGAALGGGGIILAPGESYAAPQAILAVSTQGRNGASAQQHAAIRTKLNWPGGRMRPRPVHLNSWEACYFDHDEARIGELAEAAAAIGAERFVLDDGWFRGRSSDEAGLGDWHCDPEKYPAGLAPLADRVRALGMEFGLWVEPEMVNPDSDLFRAHPEWALGFDGNTRRDAVSADQAEGWPPNRRQPTARNQLVLNMALPEVRDYLFTALDDLLRSAEISYLKWDHNRDLAPAGGAAQVAGTYDLLARLRSAHPMVEIEGCAGGGGRSDAGLVPYVHRFWTSDNIDAVSRTAMQRGFLAFLPPEIMGAHVGASPSHATGRSQSLGFRAAAAMPGHFGIELDPRQLSEDERAELADWTGFYKQWRHLLHGGQSWLGEGADGVRWQAAGSEAEFLLFVIRTDPPLDRRPQPLPLPFLAGRGEVAMQLLRIAGSQDGHVPPTAPLFAAMAESPATFTGSWLAEAGLPLPPMRGENIAIFHGAAQ